MAYIISKQQLEIPGTRYEAFGDLHIYTKGDFYGVARDGEKLLLLEGAVFNEQTLGRLLPEELLELVKNDLNKPLSLDAEYTGQYTFIVINKDKINICTDVINTFPLYYHAAFITNNESYANFFDLEADTTGFLQMTLNPYATINNRTLFKSLYKTRPGELMVMDRDSFEVKQRATDSLNIENKKNISPREIADSISRNFKLFANNYRDFIIAGSGGVDSRFLYSFKELLKPEQKVRCVSYGDADYSDNRIAAQICKSQGIPHENVPFRDQLFPAPDMTNKVIADSGNFIINAWFSIYKHFQKNDLIPSANTVMLTGDFLDILRAKNLRKERSRKRRTILFLKQAFLNYTPELTPLDRDGFLNELLDGYKRKTFQGNSFEKSVDHDTYVEECRKDLHEWLDYLIIKDDPKAQENLIELHFMYNWGARTMYRQPFVLKNQLVGVNPLASRNFVKEILQYSPWDRFEDKLTHQLFKQPQFRKFGKFPTAQMPMMNYANPILIKYLAWGMRSKLDQQMIKLHKRNLIKNPRLYKQIEWKDYYSDQNYDHLKSVLDEKLFGKVLERFKDRQSGKAWPLNEIDISCFVYPCQVLKGKLAGNGVNE